ncbi:hypothetical protein BX600DRAFT_460178 [Xylariales sp. PMI_506]|nr:hypothetical protein BX600DRAFT_460178 [Xylariales sp. PMI_506]
MAAFTNIAVVPPGPFPVLQNSLEPSHRNNRMLTVPVVTMNRHHRRDSSTERDGQTDSLDGLSLYSPSSTYSSSSGTLDFQIQGQRFPTPQRLILRPNTPSRNLANIEHNAMIERAGKQGRLKHWLPSQPLKSQLREDSGAGTEDDDHDHRWFQMEREHWGRLQERRVDIRHRFEEFKRVRSELKDLGQKKDTTYRRLLLAIREGRDKSNPKALDSLIVATEQATLLYQETDARFDGIIEELDDAELAIEFLERRFYANARRGNLPPQSPERESDDDSNDTPPPYSLRGISHDRHEDLHPLYERMRDTYGELQLAKEYLQNLNFKRVAMESKDPSSLGKDAAEFMDTYEHATSEATRVVENWSKKFEELRSECLRRGLVPEHSFFFERNNDISRFLADGISLPEDPSDDELPPEKVNNPVHSTYPILLGNPKHLLMGDFPLTAKGSLRAALALPPTDPRRAQTIQDSVQEYAISTLLADATPLDKNDYINRWLLQNLRLSSMEATVLYSAFSTRLRVRDFDRWQHDVLRLWPRDEAASRANGGNKATDANPGEGVTIASDKREDVRSEPRSRAASAPMPCITHSSGLPDDWVDLGEVDVKRNLNHLQKSARNSELPEPP